MESAVADFSTAIKLEPNGAIGYFNRGYVYLQLGKMKEAIEDLSAAIHTNPEYADAYVNRGIALLKSGERTGACSDFRIAAGMHQGTAVTLYQQFCK